METALAVKGNTDLAFQAFERLEAIATKLAQSKLIPAVLQNKPADVAIILQMGYELDMGPMQALNGIDVIQGKPSVKPEMQVALIKANAPEAHISIQTDPEKMSVTVTMAPSASRMSEAFTTTWNMDRAKAMQLDKKDNYLKQPLVMLKWRALGEAARTVFPHITKGLKNTVEAEDWDNVTAPDGSKAAALSSMIKGPEKTVPAEVAPVAQAVPTPIEPVPYLIPNHSNAGPCAGKSLDQVSRMDLLALHNSIVTFRDKSGKPLGTIWSEFLDHADSYLKSTEEKPVEPSFENFEPGAAG